MFILNYCYMYELQQYLSNDEWNNLILSTNKFSNIYKNTRIIYLNKKYSIKYLEYEYFRNIINCK